MNDASDGTKPSVVPKVLAVGVAAMVLLLLVAIGSLWLHHEKRQAAHASQWDAAMLAAQHSGLNGGIDMGMRSGMLGTGDEPLLPLKLTLPQFTLIERSGEPYGVSDLAGKVWIVNFVFTTCPGVCPGMTQAMSQIQQELADHPLRDHVRLVSVSVDPEVDTPEVLTAYADRFGADPAFWKFLTGTRAEIWGLVENAFKLPLADTPDDPGSPILHSPRFGVVDQQGVLRGYFEAMKPDERKRLISAAEQLAG